MPTQPRIEIPLGKGAPMVAAICGFIVMAFFGVLLFAFWLGWNEAAGEEKDKAFTGMVVMGAITALFGLMVLVSVKKIFFKRIGLTIDASGITHHLRKLGLIEWKDIESIQTIKIRVRQFPLNLFPIKHLVIKVHDPQKYIDRGSSVWKRMSLKADKLSFGSPITITSMPLKCSFSQLEQWVREGWERSKQAPTRENF